MKKFLLSITVIFLFTLYSFFDKNSSALGSLTQPVPTSDPNSNVPQANNSTDLSPTVYQQTSGQYKDGTYTGDAADAYYGNIQVKATIQNGKLTNVEFLQYPNDRRTSIMINQQAMPYLQQEAIQAQSANVDIVSGATDSSRAFQESLGTALSQAKS